MLTALRLSFAEFKTWWAADDEIGDELKVDSLRYFWIAPATLVYHLFDEPAWFKEMGVKGFPLYIAGSCIVWTINMLIILSTFAFCLESLPQFCSDPITYPDCGPWAGPGESHDWDWKTWRSVWWYIEVLCVSVFTIDFITRMACSIIMGSGDFYRFRTDPMNYVDIIAVFPFYIDSVWMAIFPESNGFYDMRFVRVIRLARVLQSLPDKYAGMGSIVADIIKTAFVPMFLPLYFMFLSMIVFASMAYYVERPINEICYRDGDTGNVDIANVISGWKSCRYAGCGTSGDAQMGNEGCLTDGGCGCGCDSYAHAYRKAKIYYSSCSSSGGASDDLLADYETADNTCASLKDSLESTWTLPNITGSCTGVVTYETWDSRFQDAEYSSDMFEDGAPGGIITAMWWCVVTFTTVGYGDMNPRTPQGQMIAVLTMVVGVFFLAMPLAVVGGSFHAAWGRAEADHAMVENEKALAEAEKKGLPPPEELPTAAKLVDQQFPDKSVRALQDTKGYIMAMLAKSEHLRELAGGLEEHPEIWTDMQDFQKALKKVSQTLGDQSNVVTESFLGDTYAERDENGRLTDGVLGNWWGAIPLHVTTRSHLPKKEAE